MLGSGAEQTIIDGGGTAGPVIYAESGSTIGSFTITDSGQGYWDAGIWIGDGASPTICNNRVVGNSMGIVNYCFHEPCVSAPVIRNNVVVNNRYPGIIAHLGTPQIINNTVVGNETGITVDADGVVIRNNIVVNNSYTGVSGANRNVAIGYNDVWNNGTNYWDISPGPGALSVNPRFVDAGGGDYHLLSNSPCINAGDPDPVYNDRDGSRNDMGAYGGPYAGLPCILPGDLDGDGDVDVADIMAVASNWRCRCGDQCYQTQYDLDDDCDIDIVDIMLVASRWGCECGDECCYGTTSAISQVEPRPLMVPAVVRLVPGSSTVASGETFTVAVEIEDAMDLGGFQLALTFDPAVIQVDSVTLGDFLGSTGRNTAPLGPEIDNETGRVTFGAFSFSDQPGQSGNGVLATPLTLRSQAAGSSILDMQQVQVTDTVGRSQTLRLEGGRVTVEATGEHRVHLPLMHAP